MRGGREDRAIAFPFHITAPIHGRLGASPPGGAALAGETTVNHIAPMMFRFGRAFLFVGWLLTIGGVLYVALGLRALRTGGGNSSALLLLGLVAVVVGSSVIRWARRAR